MPEIFSWNEGSVRAWTGTATASSLIMFMQNMQAMLQWGWEDHQTVVGRYDQHLTGLRADLSFQHLYGLNGDFEKMVASATAIHFKIDHSSIVNGTGGIMLWSARIAGMLLQGAEGGVFSWTVQVFGHDWSRYGN